MTSFSTSQFSESLWDFAIQFYDSNSVKLACLDLQAQIGGHVIAVLYAFWRGLRGEALTQPEPIFLLCQEWESTLTRPLRHIRDSLKQGSNARETLNRILHQANPAFEAAAAAVPLDALRQEILAIELKTERQLMDCIAQIPTGWHNTTPQNAIAENLARLQQTHASMPSAEHWQNALEPLKEHAKQYLRTR